MADGQAIRRVISYVALVIADFFWSILILALVWLNFASHLFITQYTFNVIQVPRWKTHDSSPRNNGASH